ncbi:syntenin-1-like [Apostichopus japonicus]|uniref:syntenin-1-like n=1 Tax=Stichopus japonicus TaxID=307972 RepID=UPI003AB323F4
MSLYPSLEDMKVDQMSQAQTTFNQQAHQAITSSQSQPASYASLYPSLTDWMGLDLNSTDISTQLQTQQPPAQSQAVATRSPGTVAVTAPVTGNNLGVQRAEIKQGVRQVTLCKGGDGKVGVRFQAISKGIFISFVGTNTPAAMGGLRFGDQVLQINGSNVAGWSKSKAMDAIKKSDPKRIEFAVRDRPFERTITLQRDSVGYVGFVFNKGKITAIGKDSSAARNGLLIDHAMLEVNGQNVVGIPDKKIGEILKNVGQTVTVTVMPNFVFDHMMKNISSSLVKGSMDHSVPEI